MISHTVRINRTPVRFRSGRDSSRRGAGHPWAGQWSDQRVVRPHTYGRLHIECLEWRQQEEALSRFMTGLRRLSSS